MRRDLNSERCVYLHRDKIGVFYVGMGTWSRAYTRNSRNADWHKRVNSNDGKFEVVIFECGLTITEAARIERECIAYLGRNTLVNRSDGGEHAAYGMRHTEDAKRRISLNSATRRPEHKAKLSAMMSGEGNPMFGRTHDLLARSKISDARSDKTVYAFQYQDVRVNFTRSQFRMISGANIQQVHDVIKKGRKYKGWRVVHA